MFLHIEINVYSGTSKQQKPWGRLISYAFVEETIIIMASCMLPRGYCDVSVCAIPEKCIHNHASQLRSYIAEKWFNGCSLHRI